MTSPDISLDGSSKLEDEIESLDTQSLDSDPSYEVDQRDQRVEQLSEDDEKENLALELSRSVSRSILNTEKVIRSTSIGNDSLLQMGGGRRYPPQPIGLSDDYIVLFSNEYDSECPLNWSNTRKLKNCIAVLMPPFSVVFATAVLSPAMEDLMREFHVCYTVAVLSTSLIIFGFAAGPVMWGPLSELYGRRNIYLCSTFGFACFCYAAATAKDIQTLMICRFFCGFIGGAGAVVSPSAMGDMFPQSGRGYSINAFGVILFGVPQLASIIGGFIMRNKGLSWRWPLYVTSFLATFSFILVSLIYEESHHPTILVSRAEKIRRRTGNHAIYATHEEVTLSFKEVVKYNIVRPLKMLVSEPILFLMSLYNSFIYGILYLLLTEVPLVFERSYHFSTGIVDLPYLAIFIGVLLGSMMIYFFDKRYIKKLGRSEENKLPPEDRLPPILVGSFLFPIGMFWLGWSGDFGTNVHWIVPTLSGLFIGSGLIAIFLPCLNYIVDAYLPISASALASNAFLRSSFGGVFPLFARQMFTNMHIRWATTLLGCFSTLLIPVPFIFYKYGHIIRGKSKLAVQ